MTIETGKEINGCAPKYHTNMWDYFCDIVAYAQAHNGVGFVPMKDPKRLLHGVLAEGDDYFMFTNACFRDYYNCPFLIGNLQEAWDNYHKDFALAAKGQIPQKRENVGKRQFTTTVDVAGMETVVFGSTNIKKEEN